jgi:hypothetical protein
MHDYSFEDDGHERQQLVNKLQRLLADLLGGHLELNPDDE